MEASKAENRNPTVDAAQPRRHPPVTRPRVQKRDVIEIDRDEFNDNRSNLEGVIIPIVRAIGAARRGHLDEVCPRLDEALDMAVLTFEVIADWIELDERDAVERSVEGTLTESAFSQGVKSVRAAGRNAEVQQSRIDWPKIIERSHLDAEMLRRELVSDVDTIRRMATEILQAVRQNVLLNPGDDADRGRTFHKVIADRELLASIADDCVNSVSDAATRLLEVANCIELNFGLDGGAR